jgi:DNA-binding response OmpR family regulator
MPTVLVVDDDDNVRTLTRMMLTRRGHNVLEAADGIEGEVIALRDQPDIVLLDVMMTPQDGFTTCANMRTKGYTGRIVMITALHQQHGESTARQCGADNYFLKPMTGTALINLIKETVGS